VQNIVRNKQETSFLRSKSSGPGLTPESIAFISVVLFTFDHHCTVGKTRQVFKYKVNSRRITDKLRMVLQTITITETSSAQCTLRTTRAYDTGPRDIWL